MDMRQFIWFTTKMDVVSCQFLLTVLLDRGYLKVIYFNVKPI